MKRMTYQEKLEIQKPIMMMIWEALPEKKRKTFEAAEYRNRYLTSEYMLRNGRITTYIEGWYLELEGCQSRFAVFAKDVDGCVEICRKPNENKLHRLWGMEFDNTFLD